MNTKDPRAAATRFFWGWLAAGTGASILGNVTHAMLNTAAGSPVVAAALAVVPPVALLGATHGVHALVQSRIVGAAYRAALAITVAVALAAFVLSFAALRELAIGWGGVASAIAWLVPVVIDLSITGSTIALLALSSAQRAEVVDAPVLDDAQPVAPVHVEVHNEVHTVAQAADLHVSEPADLQPGAVSVASLIAREAESSAHLAAHFPAAEAIVAQGVTRIDRVKVAEVLAEHADGTAPSMIARKLSVGYSTVVRILDHHTAQDDAQGVLDVEAVAV
ncbi:membrane protein [Mycobacterium phage DarthP]|uniref:Membrane protein n=2 Tax=Amginevirus TaxID=2946794 RepID=A0A222ZPB3_9CAUD|nr:membrane protein [Mycobacterium phage Amohnition]YP_009952036.1 membrane protein [Mycobacterium phage DarthP]ASR86358.1 membrane protein [Mycobacterium phage Amohnition]ASW31824.1 membrane protein [Mycobacterium phage DarthP]